MILAALTSVDSERGDHSCVCHFSGPRELWPYMKTTSLGILTIALAVGNAVATYLKTGACNLGELVPACTAGWALIHARDAR